MTIKVDDELTAHEIAIVVLVALQARVRGGASMTLAVGNLSDFVAVLELESFEDEGIARALDELYEDGLIDTEFHEQPEDSANRDDHPFMVKLICKP